MNLHSCFRVEWNFGMGPDSARAHAKLPTAKDVQYYCVSEMLWLAI